MIYIGIPSCCRLAVMDLIAAMVTHVDETHVDSVYSATLPLILVSSS